MANLERDTSAASFTDIEAGANAETAASSPPSTFYQSIRRYSERICQPLSVEDYGLQAMDSTSPAKWHLAHTSWFFETFILKAHSPGYREFHPRFEHLFNSYYNAVGEQYPRGQRGLLSRPTVEEVYRYRQYVDQRMVELLDKLPDGEEGRSVLQLTELGCHHEQQHQELLFTDLKYCLFQNPLFPAYSQNLLPAAQAALPMQWQSFSGGLHHIGHDASGAFCFDNELPRHQQYVERFQIADRLVSNGEYLAFMADDGYLRAELWLADGWSALSEINERERAPLYWVKQDGEWWEFSLHGLIPLDLNRPVAHLSAYEADAYARWCGCRLPTEFEWEVASSIEVPGAPSTGEPEEIAVHPNFPSPVNCLWQWTSSAYAPYPGFSPEDGAIGEYNGKFMANQLVLRGGSIVTSPGHYRHSYRNFFYPPDQWQFTGLRLARN